MKEPTLRTFSRHKFVLILPKHNQAPTTHDQFSKPVFVHTAHYRKVLGVSIDVDFCERFNGCMEERICRGVVPVRMHTTPLLVNTVELLFMVSRFYRRTALFVSLIERKVSSIKSADAEQLRLFQSSNTPRYDGAFASRTAKPTWPTRVTANAFLAQVISRVTS
jgi:hypothetical protein